MVSPVYKPGIVAMQSIKKYPLLKNEIRWKINKMYLLQIVFANWLYVSVSIRSLQEIHYDFKAVNDIDNIFNLNKLCVSFVRVLKHESETKNQLHSILFDTYTYGPTIRVYMIRNVIPRFQRKQKVPVLSSRYHLILVTLFLPSISGS